MNFAAMSAKAGKPLLTPGARPCSSVAGAKTKVSSVAGCPWPGSGGGGHAEVTWPILEAPPPKPTFQRSGGPTCEGWGCRSDSASHLEGTPTRIAVFPEGTPWVGSSARRPDLLPEQGCRKELASSGDY